MTSVAWKLLGPMVCGRLFCSHAFAIMKGCKSRYRRLRSGNPEMSNFRTQMCSWQPDSVFLRGYRVLGYLGGLRKASLRIVRACVLVDILDVTRDILFGFHCIVVFMSSSHRGV